MDKMFDEQTCSLLAPVRSGSVAIPIRSVYEAESRIPEVATANAHKAPELLATFNIAYLDVKDVLLKLECLQIEASKDVNRRKAIVILDEVPKILAAKGLSSARSPGGSEDQRNAILDTDAEYLAANDRLSLIKAMIKLMEGKLKGVEMAYTSVKKILGQDNGWKDLNQNRNLSAGAPMPDVTAGMTVDPSNPRSRFGGAK
jgi:hypothetical protein